MFKSIKITPKISVNDKQTLSLVYTPGVAASCLKISKDDEKSYDYTNRENTIGVFAPKYEDALKRAIFLKSTIGADAYPFTTENMSDIDLKFLIENLEISFGAFDLSLIPNINNINFDVKIPVLKGIAPNLKEFFLCISKTFMIDNIDSLNGDINEKSLTLRRMAGGVIETELSEEEHKKPIAIISDGSAVLGLGNIGGLAGMPVMEGKSVLFKSLGNVDAIPLCVKTQKPDEVVKIVQLLSDSLSGVNLEDISGPNCFEIENELIKTLNIPVFHDDQHGTAIVVLAGLLNALFLTKKDIENVKIVVSGAGAAACACTKLIIKTGARNIYMFDKDGILYKNRPQNNSTQEQLCETVNIKQERGILKDIIKNADVFIGLSAPNLLDESMIKSMNENPIVFALANPTPEIMPDLAKKSGAFIVASGRSDFPNQINNSLAFPGLFKGILENNVPKITDDIKINAAFAIAQMINLEELTPEHIIPDALDLNVVYTVAKSVQ